MLRLLPLLVAAALVQAAVAWSGQVSLLGRRTVSAQALGLASGGAARLRIAVVRIEGSGWTEGRALAIGREAAEILAQCEVSLQSLELETVAAPGFLDFSTSAARELVRAFPVSRPAVFLVRESRNRPAFDAEAIGRGNSRTRPELADTVWITAATRDAGIALAHELAHVLMDSGEHSQAPGNLMREETAPGHRALSADQCVRLRRTGTANGLLQEG